MKYMWNHRPIITYVWDLWKNPKSYIHHHLILNYYSRQPDTIWPKLVDLTAHFPRRRYKRNVTFTFDGVMGRSCCVRSHETHLIHKKKNAVSVAFGGALSLFLGCSFMSLAEIVYIIATRFIYGCKKSLRIMHNKSKKPQRKLRSKKILGFRGARARAGRNNNNQLPYIN